MEVLPRAAQVLEDRTFVSDQLIGPLVSAGRVAGTGGYTLRVVDTADPTKVTAECRLDGGATLFVKVYAGEEDDAHCHAVMCALWDAGFGDGAAHRIAEPLVHLAEQRIVVMRGAPGATLYDELRAGRGDRGVRQAARWLAALHMSAVRLGEPWPIWRNFARLARRLNRAAAAYPERAARLDRMLLRLIAAAEQAQNPPRLVQTHGQFRDVHVYLDGETATVIDLDRSRPADPARDVDEFLHRLRWKTFKHSATYPDGLTAAFLHEYVSHVPADQLSNLPFYAAAHALSSLARFLRKREPGDEAWERVVAFHEGEFEAALARRFGS
ncbi:MAG: aminoglycoside phosphotransferase family protein [Actinomycetota bacterium]|nr:aminoglycoside phosphotransferase family protein [Actinomycetota bacterium]